MKAVLIALQKMGVNIVDVVAVIEKGKGKALVEAETQLKVKTLIKVNVIDGKVVIEE
jgi:adenine phosphoribosyltransferase